MIRSILRWTQIGALFGALALTGCAKKPGVSNPDANADIPADPGGGAPEPQFSNIRPAGSFTRTNGNEARIRLNLLGIADPATGLPLELSAANVFVTEDGVLQGRKVSLPVQADRLKADVVFVVDNSGSMGEEADSIASRIAAFARNLEARNIDVRVGCVGHGYASDQHVYGALNLTNATTLARYLGRSTGLTRTVDYAGPDSAALAAAAQTFGGYSGGENSILGIRFADGNFAWRAGANRVYVAFTDEATQPGGDTTLATRRFLQDWSADPSRGTVHVAFSSDTSFFSYFWQTNYFEPPWELASGTGGTVKFVGSNASDLDLETLPVTGVIASSRLVEFVTHTSNGNHDVIVTVKTATADGRTLFSGIRYGTPPAAATPPPAMAPKRALARDATGRPMPAGSDPVR